MTVNYYQKKFLLAEVDKKDQLIGPVERWSAHEKAICHRGFTTILIYQKQLILQHRKHPAFDGLYDLTFSSHPIYLNEKLQPIEEAIYDSLKREWNVSKIDLQDLKYLDKFYYQAKDQKSIYTEHEIDYLYLAKINKLPKVNKDFAYGYELLNISNFQIQISNFKTAPWVTEIVRRLKRNICDLTV